MSHREHIELEHLRVEIVQTDQRAIYTFEGALDERFRFREIPLVAAPSIVFVLRDVGSLNSMGVREWVYFVRQFDTKREHLFREVSVAFVDQLNTVPQMLGRARVKSFLAPFYCPACDEEVNELLVCALHRAVLLSRHAPALAHAPCGKPLEFDALEDCYFHQVERFLG